MANTTHSMRVGAIRKCIERIVGDALTKEGKKFDQTSSLLFLSRTMYYDNEEFKALVDEDEDLSNFVLNNGRGIPDTSITQELYNKVMDIALSYYGG